MFKLIGKEINTILGAQTILIWSFIMLLGVCVDALHPKQHFSVMLGLFCA